MYQKLLPPDLNRVLKVGGLLLSSATLFACTAEPGPTSSSSDAQSSIASSVASVTPSSSSIAPASSSAAPVSSSSAPSNPTAGSLLSDGSFNTGMAQFQTPNLMNASLSRNAGYLDFNITAVSSQTWHVELVHPVSVRTSTNYTLCFDGKAASSRDIRFHIDGGEDSNWAIISGGASELRSLGTSWTNYKHTMMVSSNDTTARVQFLLGTSDVNVQLDNIGLYEGTQCGGSSTTPPSSSSSVASSAPPVASSSSAPSGGVSIDDADDFATTKSQYEANNCHLCHAPQGNGVFSAAGSASGPINISYALTPAGFVDLVDVIKRTMPKNSAGNCTDANNCAVNTAAYMVGLISGNNGQSSSAVTSSSSSAGNPVSGNYADYTPNIEMGRILYEQDATQDCALCHGSADMFAPDIQGYDSDQTLFDKIVKTMPLSGDGSRAGDCVGQCAADITAYLRNAINSIVVLSCNPNEPVTYGIRKMRLLTAQQYINSVEDLGIAQAGELARDDFVTDDFLIANSYAPHSTTVVDSSRHFKFMTIAEELADSAASRISNGCSSASQCATRFNDFATRIYRRPLTNQERTDFTEIFNEFGDEGMAVALQTALMSPHFLYRSENGVSVSEARSNGNLGLQNVAGLNNADTNAYVLDAYEFATALSYMYTGSTPDQTLLQAAGNGGLNSETGVNSQIDRLLNTQRGREHMGRFASTWMRTDAVVDQKRPDFPEFTEQVAKDMAEEVRQLFRHVFYTSGVPFDEFYSGDYAVVNQNLARFYQIPFNGNGWAKTGDLPNRGGIITTGAFMTNNATNERTGPILRAVRIREQMLCHHIDPPPANLGDDRTELELHANMERNLGMMTSRRLFEVFTDSPACAGCHADAINPLFGVEDFDQVGRFRSTMRGLPGVSIPRADGTFDNSKLGVPGVDGLMIDNYGELRGTTSAKGSDVLSFNGSKDLGDKIANLPSVRECMVINAFRYTTGLPIAPTEVFKEPNGDPKKQEPILSQEQVEDFACAKDILESEYVSSQHSAKEVFKKIGTLELVRFRK